MDNFKFVDNGIDNLVCEDMSRKREMFLDDGDAMLNRLDMRSQYGSDAMVADYLMLEKSENNMLEDPLRKSNKIEKSFNGEKLPVLTKDELKEVGELKLKQLLRSSIVSHKFQKKECDVSSLAEDIWDRILGSIQYDQRSLEIKRANKLSLDTVKEYVRKNWKAEKEDFEQAMDSIAGSNVEQSMY